MTMGPSYTTSESHTHTHQGFLQWGFGGDFSPPGFAFAPPWLLVNPNSAIGSSN